MPYKISALIAAVFCLSACQTTPTAVGCRIEGPIELMPQSIRELRLGMTRAEIEELLGPADYSPVDGVFYFSTGGDCPLEEGERVASCGLVAEFRDYEREDDLMETLQSCWWGAIGE